MLGDGVALAVLFLAALFASRSAQSVCERVSDWFTASASAVNKGSSSLNVLSEKSARKRVVSTPT